MEKLTNKQKALIIAAVVIAAVVTVSVIRAGSDVPELVAETPQTPASE